MALHAQVLVLGRDVDREAQLTVVAGGTVRVVADGAGDAFVLRQRGVLLYVFDVDAPGLERALCGVTRGAAGCLRRVAADHGSLRGGVLALAPFLDEGVMGPIVTLGAAVGGVHRRRDGGERLVAGVGDFHVIGAGAVTALALHIVVGRVLHHTPSGRLAHLVARLVHGVAGEA